MLQLEQKGSVLHVTLNKPEVRNAFDEAMIAAVTKAFTGPAREKDVRAVVVRGAGRDFCAGADVRWMRRAADFTPAQSRKDAAKLAAMCAAIQSCPNPVLAGVQGNCFGGGLGIVAACDVVVAAEDAVMAFSECRLGIAPAVISNFVLPKIGEAAARRWFLTAESFSAGAANGMGLVHEVVPEAQIDAQLGRLLEWILKAGPNAVRASKKLIFDVRPLPAATRLAHTIKLIASLRSSDEGRAGLSAFLDKRAAPWIEPK